MNRKKDERLEILAHKNIAIVMYGQPRHTKNEFLQKQWRRILHENNEVSFDLYINFWDTVSNIEKSNTYDDFVKCNETEIDVKYFKSLPNLKNFNIHNCNIMDKILQDNFANDPYITRRIDLSKPESGYATLGQWVSTDIGFNQILESENTYDIVLRIRWDLSFTVDNFTILKNIYETTKNKNRTVGATFLNVSQGHVLLNDWYNTIPYNDLIEFKEDFINKMCSIFSSKFVGDMPFTVQENSWYDYVYKQNFDTCQLYCDCSVWRESDQEWHWPNFY